MMNEIQKEKQEEGSDCARHDGGVLASTKPRRISPLSARNKKIMKVAFVEFALALILACACKCATGFWKVHAEQSHNEALIALKTIWEDSKKDYRYIPHRTYGEIEFETYDPRRYYVLLCRKIENLSDSWSETLSRPFRRIDRAVVSAKERFPEYVESSLEMFVAGLADSCLHWIVFTGWLIDGPNRNQSRPNAFLYRSMSRNFHFNVHESATQFVFCFIVLKTMIWIVAKFINGWVDGPLIDCKSLETVMLDNGDIVIRLEQAKQGATK